MSPELEYCFRDIANIYAGENEIVLEPGNMHRAMPGKTTISNRIVLSVTTANELLYQIQINDMKSN